jgi:hypothetical protein
MAEKELKAEEERQNRQRVLQLVFDKYYIPGAEEVTFSLKDIRDAIKDVSAKNPRYKEDNVPDVRYSFASGRLDLPPAIAALGNWVLVGRGRGKYALQRSKTASRIEIQADLTPILLPDATPEIVTEYAGADEQGILAKVHYNRLVDTFLQITCYHLQNHWRTSIKNKGQCEIDDLYVGVDIDGKQYVVPIEAKSAKETINKVQVAQMIDLARERYPKLIIRAVGIQELKDGSLVFIEFPAATSIDEISIKEMRRYRLVEMKEIKIGRG